MKAVHTTQYQKNEQTNQKVSQRTKLSPKKTYKWLINHEKMLNITHLSEKCKSKPQWGTISHWSEWLPSKSLQTINAGEGVEKTLLVGMQTDTTTMENSVEIP